MILLAFIFVDFYLGPLFSAKMTNLKLSKQKKLMTKARARRGDQSNSKSDLTGIQTRALKRKKVDIIKEVFIISDPESISVLPPEDSKSISPKKMKILMSDDVSQADLTITNLM